MKCKYCGAALSTNVAYCPNCKRMMSDDQLRERKDINGYKNPYAQRLDNLNYLKFKNKLEENENPKYTKQIVCILLIVVLVIILGIVIF